MKKLRIALGAQLLFFGIWGAWLLSSRNTAAPEFYLETSPVDPRDLISGTYVSLSYEISTPQAEACFPLLRNGHSLFVKLENRGKTAATAQGPVPVYEATDCSLETRDGYGWVSATPEIGGPRLVARYGIERFFINEGNPLKDALSGSVLAKVKIDGSRQLVLLDLVHKLQTR